MPRDPDGAPVQRPNRDAAREPRDAAESRETQPLPVPVMPAPQADAMVALAPGRPAPVGPVQLSGITASNPAMKGVLRLAHQVAAADCAVLILGETGVGKDWLARAIHASGPRSKAPFLALNAAALPDSLLESELFGHEAGAFTGAIRTRKGHFERAHRGTLFLDEIADLSPHLQVKLLRVLQDHKVRRVGGEDEIQVDVRVLAATNQNLAEKMDAQLFRRDLYYRMSVVSLTVPPLRDRPEDLPAIIEHYLAFFRAKLGRDAVPLSDAALAALLDHSWPGNVRELMNVLERAVLLCDGVEIRPGDLPEGLTGAAAASTAERSSSPAPVPEAASPAELSPSPLNPDGLDRDGPSADPRPAPPSADWLDRSLRAVRGEAVAEVERRYLAAQLTATRGHIGQTARRAGITPRALYGKMRALGLDKETFKQG